MVGVCAALAAVQTSVAARNVAVPQTEIGVWAGVARGLEQTTLATKPQISGACA